MNTSTRGFSLAEVVISIAIGIIVLMGVTVGFTYSKRAAIVENQRKEVQVIKQYVEQAIADYRQNGTAQNTSPGLSWPQLDSLRDSLPTWKNDPYTGATRVQGCSSPTSCYTDEPTPISGAIGPGLAGFTRASQSWTKGAGSAIIYIYGSLLSKVITITLIDGSTLTVYGFAVIETDADGNIVAAAGGDSKLAY